MTWENRGRRQGVLGWELDHIRPLSSFVLPDEWRDAFHYTNVQPLWCEDNLRKGAATRLSVDDGACTPVRDPWWRRADTECDGSQHQHKSAGQNKRNTTYIVHIRR